MTLRTPGPKTTIPTAILVKPTGEEIEMDDPILVALTVAIAEDFLEPMPASGWSDVISAAASAVLTLRVLAAAGLTVAEAEDDAVYVDEGWWHPNVRSGQVHLHKSNQPMTMHRTCEPVYTRRQIRSTVEGDDNDG